MKLPPVEPGRLADLPPRDDPANLARLVRSAIEAPSDQVPRLKWRIRSTLRRRSIWRRRYLRVAFVGGAMFLTGGVVGAALQPIFQSHQPGKTESVQKIYPSPSAARSPRARSSAPASDFAEPAASVSSPSPAQPDPEQPLSAQRGEVGSRSEPGEGRASPNDEPSAMSTQPRPTRAEAAAAALPPVSRPRPLSGTTESPKARMPGGLSASQGQGPRMAMLEPPPPVHQALPTRSPSVLPTPPVAEPKQGSVASLALATPRPEVPAPTSPAGNVVSRPVPLAAAPAAVVPVSPAPAHPNEQALLARALFSLRSEHRPEKAIVVLDQYRAEFPAGSLLPEAARLRTEALLALGQKSAALAELNRETEPGGANGEESKLVRAELRAAAGWWRGAFEDFDAVVSARGTRERAAVGSTSPKLRERSERALWGRASARGHLGDETGARADLREYLRRFPRGQFAAEAARLLGELP